jgi:hypothetical protein
VPAKGRQRQAPTGEGREMAGAEEQGASRQIPLLPSHPIMMSKFRIAGNGQLLAFGHAAGRPATGSDGSTLKLHNRARRFRTGANGLV